VIANFQLPIADSVLLGMKIHYRHLALGSAKPRSRINVGGVSFLASGCRYGMIVIVDAVAAGLLVNVPAVRVTVTIIL